MKIPIDKIVVSKDNPRQSFDEEGLRRLGESIKEHGQLQAIIVRPKGSQYELVVGERRLKASQIIGLSTIEAVVKDVDDRQCNFYRLIENTQREDLTGAEKGNGIAHILKNYPELTIKDIAKELQKSKRIVHRWIQKSEWLSDEVKKYVVYKKLSDLIVTALLKFSHEEQNKLAKAIINYKLQSKKEGRFLHREFIQQYELNPEKYPTVESLEDLANEVKGIRKVNIDLDKLSPEARAEVERKLKEAEEEAKKLREKTRKPRVMRRWRGRPKKHKPKPKLEEPEKKQPIPEPTISIKIRAITVAFSFPDPLWEKINRYIAKANQPMLLEEAIISLLESHPSLRDL